jgi:1-deoxy-D-xylulose 5-phosphate reductoisomerase
MICTGAAKESERRMAVAAAVAAAEAVAVRERMRKIQRRKTKVQVLVRAAVDAVVAAVVGLQLLQPVDGAAEVARALLLPRAKRAFLVC